MLERLERIIELERRTLDISKKETLRRYRDHILSKAVSGELFYPRSKHFFQVLGAHFIFNPLESINKV